MSNSSSRCSVLADSHPGEVRQVKVQMACTPVSIQARTSPVWSPIILMSQSSLQSIPKQATEKTTRGKLDVA
jgi:hypothetical protein